ncbi:MAG: GDSL-type esterase/lipase family protein [Selenomonadaceae bacterium]|nr:GDSL-type esterase/lipase family protein [Selenomonadaceae bacterium]
MPTQNRNSGCRRYIVAALIALLMTVLLAAGLTFLPRLFGISLTFPVSFAKTVSRDSRKPDKAADTAAPAVRIAAVPDTISLKWEPIPNAVNYEFLLLQDDRNTPDSVILRQVLYTNGTFLTRQSRHYPDSTEALSKARWTVRGLDYRDRPVSDFSAPLPLTAGAFDSPTLLISGELDKMADAPLYPSYAWIPRDDTPLYEVEVWQRVRTDKENADYLLAVYHTEEIAVFDPMAYRRPGSYFWRVRPLRNNSQGDGWSEPQFFRVNPPEEVQIAALGDSITHGGGSIAAPPCYTMYTYMNYSPVPIKNLGRSGDTTGDLTDRFEDDVLPFAPKTLLIMGGINDLRLGFDADSIIANLAWLEEAARENGITPVFSTVLPLNPQRMAEFTDIEPVAEGWQAELTIVNEWIRSREHFIDISSPELVDEKGWLRESCSADGLHPDASAKKIIGETIGKYLQKF